MNDSPYSGQQLSYFENLLREKRVVAVETFSAQQDILIDEGDGRHHHHHMPESASDAASRERAARECGRQRKYIAAIDRALERIQHGTYGVCAGCKQVIPMERLKIVPEASKCCACKNGRGTHPSLEPHQNGRR